MDDSNIVVTLPYWEEASLAVVCGVANAGGGSIVVNESGKRARVETRRFRKPFETIPTLTMNELGLACTTEPVMNGANLCLEINVPAAEEPISYRGSYYLYSNGYNHPISVEELNHLYDKNAETAWESRLQPFVREEDLNDTALSTMAERVEAELGKDIASEESLTNLLQRFGIKSKQTDAFTNLGVLLIHRSPEQYIPGAYVLITLFDPDNKKNVILDPVTGPITMQLSKTLDLLYSTCFPEMVASNVALPPREAVREGLLNALVHKDYESGIPVKVSVSPTTLYIDNVGRPPAGWTTSDLLDRHNARPNNPNLALSLQRHDVIDGLGSGISTMVNACAAAGLPAPKFTLRADEMDVCFSFGEAFGEQGSEGSLPEGSLPQGSVAGQTFAGQSPNARSQEGRSPVQTHADASSPSAGSHRAQSAESFSHTASPSPFPNAPSSALPSSSTQASSPSQNAKPTFKERSVAAANRLDMTSTDEYILKVIETNGRVTATRIAEVLGVSESTVRRSFRRLRELGFIERIGSDKAGYWRIVD